MDFELSDDEVALAEGIRSLCAGRFPLERLRAAEDGSTGVLDRATAARPSLAEAGVFSLQVPESAGGVGLGMAAGAVVFEELGRALVPGPLLATHLAADLGARRRGRPTGRSSSVRSAGRGRRAVAVVGSGGARPHAGRPLLARSAFSSWWVTTDSSAVDPAELEAVRIGRPLDPLTPLWRVDRLPEGRPIGGPDEARTWRRDRVGPRRRPPGRAGRGQSGMAVAYAKQREQFGKPIGSFQAVKHMCADMLVAAETARAAVQAAAVTIDQPGSATPTGRPPGPGSWPPRRPSRTGRPPSRSTGGWASPGRSRPTST